MRFRSTISAVSVFLIAFTADPQVKHAEMSHAHVPDELLSRPLPLRDGIGQAHENVTTSSRDAQAYYDQGLAYLHSYVWIEASRSFNQALRLDSKLAMAYLGLSYALGELGESTGARRASEQASALANAVTDREWARISLRAKQLAAGGEPDRPSLQADYVKQFDQVLSRYPNDVELLLLRGQAQGRTHDAPGMGGGEGSVPFYERALAQQPHYFATHHYLIHAYENLGRTDRALEHAGDYLRSAPAVPHAHHMYGHVLRRVGRLPALLVRVLSALVHQSYPMAYGLRSSPMKSPNHPPETRAGRWRFQKSGPPPVQFDSQLSDTALTHIGSSPLPWLAYSFAFGSLAASSGRTGRHRRLIRRDL